jgi:hypothetical protein
VALNRFAVYFVASADRSDIEWTGTPAHGAYSVRTAWSDRSSRAPITITLGSTKSSRAVAARRNSGFMARPKSLPAKRPEANWITGRTSSSQVPGGTVLRTTTAGHPGWVGRAVPMASEAWRTNERSTRPATVGVGTDSRYASA